MLASAALLAAVAALLAPRWALLLLLAALPFAVHHPSTAPTVLLVVMAAAFGVGYLVRTRPSWAGIGHAMATRPILLLAALFAAAACLSLATLPLASIWRGRAYADFRARYRADAVAACRTCPVHYGQFKSYRYGRAAR